MPVPFARISSNRYNWHAAASDANGFYRLPWLDAGRYSISVIREGYEAQIRPLAIVGDTESDFTLVRR